MVPSHSASGHRASAFEEKSNNPYKQGNKETKMNTVKGIHRSKAHCISQIVQCLSWARTFLQKLHPKVLHSTLSHLSFIILVVAFGVFQLRIGRNVSFDVFLSMGSFTIHNVLASTASHRRLEPLAETKLYQLAIAP
jgi:heme A synthase